MFLLMTSTLSNSMLNRVHSNWEGNDFHWYSLDPKLQLTFHYTWWHGLSARGEIKVFPTNRQQAPDLLDQIMLCYMMWHAPWWPEAMSFCVTLVEPCGSLLNHHEKTHPQWPCSTFLPPWQRSGEPATFWLFFPRVT